MAPNPNIRSFGEQKLRAQKQFAVAVVLASIPLSFFLFLRAPVSEYLENRDRLAVAEAESVITPQLIRADEQTAEAAEIASGEITEAEFEQRIDDAAQEAKVKLASVEIKGTQATVRAVDIEPAQFADFMSRLSEGLDFTAEGQIRATQPVILTSKVTGEENDAGQLELTAELRSSG